MLRPFAISNDAKNKITGKSVVTPLNARDGIGLETDTKSSVFLENEEEK